MLILQARDNMKLFLMAGSETTASSIPVLIYLLTIYPDVQVSLCRRIPGHPNTYVYALSLLIDTRVTTYVMAVIIGSHFNVTAIINFVI